MLHGATNDRSTEYVIGMNKNIQSVDSSNAALKNTKGLNVLSLSLQTGTQMSTTIGGLSAGISGLEAIGVEIGQSREILMNIQAITTGIIGAMHLYQLLRSLVMAETSTQMAVAEIETTVALATQNYAAVATASLGAAAVIAGFAGGGAVYGIVDHFQHKETTITVSGVDVNNPEGQQQIEATMRQQAQEAEI